MFYHTLSLKSDNQLVLGYNNDTKGFVVGRKIAPYQFESRKEYLNALKDIGEEHRRFKVKTYCLFEVGKRPTEKELKAFLKGVFWDDVFNQLAYIYPLEIDDIDRDKYKSFADLVVENGYHKDTIHCLIETAVINGMRDGIKELK